MKTVAEFLKFHSGYFGDQVDDIRQIVQCGFSGEELLDYLNAFEQSENKEEWVNEIDRARFWMKVSQSDYCWEWNGYLNNNGYGIFRIKGNKTFLAHRFSYMLVKGDLDENLCICHKCDNPKCVNPLHLFQGTHQDNMDDKVNKGRSGSTFKTSKYFGVGWRRDSKNWRAYYSKGMKRPKSLGAFKNEIDAAKRYDEYCISIGDYSKLNFPLPSPPANTN